MKKVINNSNIKTMDDFIREMKKVKEMQFIKTHRKGPTGIGKTLEDILQVDENCVPGPDLHMIELKSARKGSQSMLTLTTKSPDVKGVNSRLRDLYGYKTEESIALNSELNILHTTVNGLEFNTLRGEEGFKLEYKDEVLKLVHAVDGDTEVYWSKKSLQQAFSQKYPIEKLYYVKADTEIRGGVEHFHYTEAYLLENFSPEKLLQNIIEGIIEVDIRIGIYTKGKQQGKSHDHGTGLRIRPDKLDLCFENKIQLI